VDLLWPIKWLIELILVSFHTVFSSVGFSFDSGGAWVLAIVGLVLVVRAALIPVFVRQIKSQRNMMLVQPQLAKLQKKYKGKTDRDSRERFAKEQMALYKETGSNPLSSCLPLILQMPIFISLFYVLNGAQRNEAGVGVLNASLAQSFSQAKLFGATLSDTFFGSDDINVKVIAAIMIVLMSSSQFITQKQIMAKNPKPRYSKQPVHAHPEDHALHTSSGLPVFRADLSAGGYDLLVGFQLLDHGPAIHCYSQHAYSWFTGAQGATGAPGAQGQAAQTRDTPAIEEETPEPEVRQRNQPVSKNRSKKKRKK